MTSRTREIVLRTLRTRGKCTVNDLALAAEVSPVSVRHHLAGLQAEGLIASEELKHGVGRPRLMFSLTENASELFPGRYMRLTNRLLGELKEHLPEGQLQDLLTGVASSMANSYATEVSGMSLDGRLQHLQHMLSEEGFDAELERQGDQLLIRELSCPYFRIGKEHPEVCTIDQGFIAQALAVPVERVTCLLHGDYHCTFAVQLGAGH